MNKRVGLLGLIVVGCSASCGSNAGSDSASQEKTQATKSSIEQASALLESTASSSWQWSSEAQDALAVESGLTRSHVEGRSAPLLVNGIGARDATIAFLAKNRDRYKMNDPAKEFVVAREQHDNLGMTHVRMQQVERGVPVRHAETMAHYDASGALRVVDSHYVSGLASLDVSPRLSAEQALAVARGALAEVLKEENAAGGAPSEVRTGTAPELSIHAMGEGRAALAYHVVLRADGSVPHRMDYMIDAKNGAILQSFDDIQTIEGTGKGVLGDTKNLQITEDGTGYSLLDTTRTPNGIRTFSLANKTTPLPGSIVTSTTTSAWDTTAARGPGAAVDAHFFTGLVYDYFKEKHARLGINGQNAQIISSVHYGANVVNAFWDGEQMAYGDGDGTQYRALSVALDVVGHELTHGVTQFTSQLVYQNQSGALNESMSDIFGAIIEHHVKPDAKDNWVLGEEISVNRTPLRDLAHPATQKQPEHLSKFLRTAQDNGGVHTNSGIPNNAFFLMTQGGTNDVSKVAVPAGIGWDKAAQLWYRIETTYLTSNSNFTSVATGSLKAAQDLQFSQNEQNIVECAWIAVGIITSPATCKEIGPEPPPGGGRDGGGGGGGGGDGGGGGRNDGGLAGANPGDGDGNGGEDDDDALGLKSSRAGCSVGAAGASPAYGAVMLAAAGLGGLLARRRRRAKAGAKS